MTTLTKAAPKRKTLVEIAREANSIGYIFDRDLTDEEREYESQRRSVFWKHRHNQTWPLQFRRITTYFADHCLHPTSYANDIVKQKPVGLPPEAFGSEDLPSAWNQEAMAKEEIDRVLGPIYDRVEEEYMVRERTPCNVPSEYWRDMDFYTICRARYSSGIMTNVSHLFTNDCEEERDDPRRCRSPREMRDAFVRYIKPQPRYRLFGKIENGFWRLFHAKECWNQSAFFFNALRACGPKIREMTRCEVSIDWTTYCNERGYSHFARTFLDLPVALLLREPGKREPFLKISIFPNKEDQLMLGQVQGMAKGNRVLYKVLRNRGMLSFAVELVSAAFPHYQILIPTPESGVEMVARSYRNCGDDIKRPSDETYERIRQMWREDLLKVNRKRGDYETEYIGLKWKTLWKERYY